MGFNEIKSKKLSDSFIFRKVRKCLQLWKFEKAKPMFSIGWTAKCITGIMISELSSNETRATNHMTCNVC